MKENHPLSKFSADWCFLSGINVEGRTLVVVDSLEDLAFSLNSSFRFPVYLVQHSKQQALSARDLNSFEKPHNCLAANLLQAPFSSSSFDTVAVPYGFPGGKTRSARNLQEEYCRTAVQLLKPGGVLYMGFFNKLDFHSYEDKGALHKPVSSLMQISRILKKVGYASVTFYGAIRDHQIPIYLFPLEPEIAGFIFSRHYGKKLPGRFAGLLTHPALWWFTRHLIPSYGIVARKK